MIINKIQIVNFGVFYGENTIDLRPKASGKNIILIGGKNGSGKTTFLECIKLAIYGPRVYGIKKESKQYFKIIEERFNRTAIREGKTNASVNIEIEIFEEGIINTYYISREWEFDNRIRENINISKNNEPLNKQDVLDVENYFGKFMPKNLFDFFFFDGERIKDLIYGESFEENMRKPILTLFNLDIYDYLDVNLGNYLKQDNIFMSLSIEEQDFEKKKILKINKTKKIDSINRHIEEIKINIEKSADLIKNTEKEFYDQGGKYITKIEKMQNKINKLENEKKQSYEQLRKFVSELLPFIILREEIQKLGIQIEKEESYEIYEKIENLNLSNKIEESIANEFEDVDLVKNIIFRVNEIYIKSIKPKGEVYKIHDLTKDESFIAKAILKEVIELDYTKVEEIYKKIDEDTNKIYDIKEKIKQSRNNSELIILQEKLNIFHKETTIYEQELIRINDDLINESKELVILEKELNKSKERLYQAKVDNNKGVIVNKIQTVLEKYIMQESNVKTEKISIYFLEMFNKLIRKESFIYKVECIQDTFAFKMYNEHGDIIDKKIFSEGEKQIYILSLLWAYIKVSGREIPLVFDTLLGRLDKSHRNNIVKNFLPNSAKQTIILSTDSEIDEDTYKILSDYIAQDYVFNYLESDEKVSVENGYFF